MISIHPSSEKGFNSIDIQGRNVRKLILFYPRNFQVSGQIGAAILPITVVVRTARIEAATGWIGTDTVASETATTADPTVRATRLITIRSSNSRSSRITISHIITSKATAPAVRRRSSTCKRNRPSLRFRVWKPELLVQANHLQRVRSILAIY